MKRLPEYVAEAHDRCPTAHTTVAGPQPINIIGNRIGAQTVVLARGVRDERSRYSPKKKAISSSQLLQGTGSPKGAGNGAPGTTTLLAFANSFSPAVPKCMCSW